jgi:hypothetical protein
MRAWTVVGRADRAVAQLDAMQRAGLAVDVDVYRALVQPHLMLLLDTPDGAGAASAGGSASAVGGDDADADAGASVDASANASSGADAVVGNRASDVGHGLRSAEAAPAQSASSANDIVAPLSTAVTRSSSSDSADTAAADKKALRFASKQLYRRALTRTRPIVGVLQQLAQELGLFVSADDTYRALVRAWCTMPRPTHVAVSQTTMIRAAIRDLLLFRLRSLRVRPTADTVVFALQCIAAAKSTVHASVVIQFAFFLQQRCRMPLAATSPTDATSSASLAPVLNTPNVATNSAAASSVVAIDAEVAAAILHADVWIYLLSIARTAKDYHLARNCVKMCVAQFGAELDEAPLISNGNHAANESSAATIPATATRAPAMAQANKSTPSLAALREEVKRVRAFVEENRPKPQHQNQHPYQQKQPKPQPRQQPTLPKQQKKQPSKQAQTTRAEPPKPIVSTIQQSTATSSRVL